MMLVPRLGEDGSFIWYLRGVITRRMFFCDKIPMQSAFDIGLHRKWIESHFKVSLLTKFFFFIFNIIFKIQPSVEDKCGRRKIPYVQLVHLGENTQRGDWPWHGALFYDNNYRCGATLISQTILLTGKISENQK